MLLVLQHRRPDGDIDAYHLKPVRRYHIGRGSNCEIRILDLKMSRQHAAVEFRDGGWQLIDLGSTNGCLIDGQQISGGRPLAVGMSLEIGQSTLVVESIGVAILPAHAMRTPMPAEIVVEPEAGEALPRQRALEPLPVHEGETPSASTEDFVDTVGVAPRLVPLPATPVPPADDRPYFITVLGVRVGPLSRAAARELKAKELKGILRLGDLDSYPRA